MAHWAHPARLAPRAQWLERVDLELERGVLR